MQGRHLSGDVVTGLRDGLLRHDLNAFEPGGPPEVLQERLSDVARSNNTPALDWPAFAMRCACKIGSSLIEPLFSRNVHSPNQSSEPHTLIAGTRKRRSTSSRIATEFSLMCGPITATHPSSTSSPNASIAALTLPFGNPYAAR